MVESHEVVDVGMRDEHVGDSEEASGRERTDVSQIEE
jgi:hypothetical protein